VLLASGAYYLLWLMMRGTYGLLSAPSSTDEEAAV
jgi:hypothetical protein